MARLRVCITWGATEPITTSSTCPSSSPKRWKYWHSQRPSSSLVRLASVMRRKLPISSAPR